MICKVCNVNNSEDSKFCVECGVGLLNEEKTINAKHLSSLANKRIKWKPLGEKDRIVSAEEMKKLLWSIDWSKMAETQKEKTMREIEMMFKLWKNDPHYIPIITAPRRNDGGFIQVPKDIDMKKFEKEWKKEMDDEIYSKRTSIQEMKKLGVSSINTTKIDTCGCVEQVFVYNYRSPIPKSCATCHWQNPNHPDNEQSVEDRFVSRGHEEEHDPTKIKDMEEKLAEIYPGILCGMCGTVDCRTKHIPPIQQQYQEAFENIQHLRHRKYLKYCLSKNPRELDVTELREYGLRGIKDYRIRKASDLAKIYYPHLFHEDVFGKPKPSERRGNPPKSRITGIN